MVGPGWGGVVGGCRGGELAWGWIGGGELGVGSAFRGGRGDERLLVAQ